MIFTLGFDASRRFCSLDRDATGVASTAPSLVRSGSGNFASSFFVAASRYDLVLASTTC